MGALINPMAGQPAPPPNTSVSPMAGGAPSVSMPPPPNVQPAPNPQQAAAAHDSLIGKAFKALSGQTTQYSVGPDGKMQQTQVQNTPGQFFKNVVASALLGAAMGEDKARQNEGSGLAAFAQGGNAVVNRDQQMNQQRIAQARADYEDQLKAQQNQREQSQADREAQEAPLRQQMLKAQTAGYNAQVARETIEAQGKDFSYHKDVADAGKQKAASIFDSNGIAPFKTGLSESEAAQFIKDTPGASSKYIAIPTGTKTTLDKNGQPVWENTFSLYDNSVTTPITDSWLKTPEMQALKTKDPDYYAVLQRKAAAKETITPEQRTSILTNAKVAYGEQTQRNAADLAAKREQALIDEAKAHMSQYYAEINKLHKDQQDQDFAKGALEAVLSGSNGTYKKGDKIPSGAKIGDPMPVTPKQYAAALPVLTANAKTAHDDWIAAIDAAAHEDDPNGPLHKAVAQAGVDANEARSVVSGIIRRAGGNITNAEPAGGGRYIDSDGTPYDLPDAATVKAFLAAHPNAKPSAGGAPLPNQDEQVTVKLGNTTQVMSRGDFAANKAKWAKDDASVNPQAAAWKNATITGVAPPPPGPRTYVSPGALY